MTTKSPTVDQIVNGIITYLKSADAENLAPAVINKLVHHYDSQTKAVITTPVDMNDSQKQSAKMIITKLSGIEDLEYTFEKDDTIIDGMKVRIGDKLWDLSVKGQLTKLLEKI